MPKQYLNPKSLPRPPVLSQGVRAGNTVYVSGQVSVGVDAQGQRVLLHKGDYDGQVRQVVRNIEAVMQEAGGTLDDVVKLTIFVLDETRARHTAELVRSFFKTPPAQTLVAAKALGSPDLLVEIEAVGVLEN